MSAADLDWAALYQKHRVAMYGAALSVLARKAPDLANDAVHAAMVSIMEKPPDRVDNWEAILVSAAKRRAIDMVRSHAMSRSVELKSRHDVGDGTTEFAVIRRLDRVERAKKAIAALSSQESYVLNEYLVHDRDRAQVASELGVSPARVSQIATKIRREIRAATEEGG